jgi:serine/threonine protein kinase
MNSLTIPTAEEQHSDYRIGSISPELPTDALGGHRFEKLLAQSKRFEVHRYWSAARAVPVAVKFARPSAGVEAAQLLYREGELLRSLAHPNLVRAYGLVTDPYPAVVMELLSGPTLSKMFERDGRISAPDSVQMGRQIASVLHYLHDHNWLHCDLKPANVLAVGGRAMVIDLSLARRPGCYERRHGTQGYLAPEQCERRPVSPATDVWGLGLLLLEALTGRDPYPPDCPEYRDQHGPLAAPPRSRWPRSVGSQVRELVRACTAYDPAQRPQLSEVMESLDRLARNSGRVRRVRGMSG